MKQAVNASPSDRALSGATLARAGALFLATILTAQLGYVLSASHEFPTFWPPAGLALAVLLLADLKEWPLLITAGVLGCIASDMMHGTSLAMAFGPSLAGAVEALAGALLVRMTTGGKPSLQTVRQVVVFVVFGALLAPAFGATIAALLGVLGGVAYPWWALWGVRWIADVSGVIVVASPILSGFAWFEDFHVMSPDAQRAQIAPVLLGGVVIASFALVSWQVFTVQSGLSSFKFLLFPGILIADAVGGPFAGATYLFIVAITGIEGMASHAVHDAPLSIAQALTVLQAEGFFIIAGITSLALSAAVLDNRRLAASAIEVAQRLERMVQQIVAIMGRMVETRDPYTRGHEEGVARLAELIAREMGLPEEDVVGITMASLVHDIGKLSLPAEILNKPGRLSPVEFSLIMEHAQIGYEVLEPVGFDWPIAETVRQHHERMDGSGYPLGLRGEQILLSARIIAVADVVDAMASHRPYRPSMGFDAAIAEIRDNPDKFDREVCAACMRLWESGRINSCMLDANSALAIA